MSEHPIFSHGPLECPGELEATSILMPNGHIVADLQPYQLGTTFG